MQTMETTFFPGEQWCLDHSTFLMTIPSFVTTTTTYVFLCNYTYTQSWTSRVFFLFFWIGFRLVRTNKPHCEQRCAGWNRNRMSSDRALGDLDSKPITLWRGFNILAWMMKRPYPRLFFLLVQYMRWFSDTVGDMAFIHGRLLLTPLGYTSLTWLNRLLLLSINISEAWDWSLKKKKSKWSKPKFSNAFSAPPSPSLGPLSWRR